MRRVQKRKLTGLTVEALPHGKELLMEGAAKATRENPKRVTGKGRNSAGRRNHATRAAAAVQVKEEEMAGDKKLLATAVRAVKEAGRIHLKYFRRLKSYGFKEYVTNIVTKADLESEKAIKDIIRKTYPSHGFLAEESGEENSTGEYRWIIDPLDGTVNYAHGFPLFCSSVAVQKKGVTLAGAVFAAYIGELYTARKGKGAFLNGKRLRVSGEKRLNKSLTGTGFPYSIYFEQGNQFERFRNIATTGPVRRGGAAALDLCYVASGVFEGFFEQGLKPWDTAAAALLVEEAGGKLTNYSGGKFDIFGNETLASNGRIHNQLSKLLAK